MAKKKKQIHLNIIDFQKYYQTDDLLLDTSISTEKKTVDNQKFIRKNRTLEKDEVVQNIDWRTFDNEKEKETNNENTSNVNKIKSPGLEKKNFKKSNDVITLGAQSKENDTNKSEKPLYLRRLEEYRKKKKLESQANDTAMKMHEKEQIDDIQERKEEIKEEFKEEVKEEIKEIKEEIKEIKEIKEELKNDISSETTKEEKNTEHKKEETEKKKFIPKRVIMYQQELKEKEERNLKLLEQQRKEREMRLQLIRSKTQGTSSTFIPSAKLKHLESLKEEKKKEVKTNIQPKDNNNNNNNNNIAVLKNNKNEEQNVIKKKSIFLEIAEKTENAKIVEKTDIEEIAKKKREELYKKQLEKITKKNEEHLKYNNIYKHDVNIIKNFYNEIKDKIIQNYYFNQDDCISLCSILKTDDCNYMESHVPFYVVISIFMLSLPQKLQNDDYFKRASNIKNLLIYLKENSKIENHEDYILNDTLKFCDQLKYPHLSEETSLIETIFDTLLYSGVISKNSFIQWFQDDDSNAELKSKAMLQLIYWHKWLTEEEKDQEEEIDELDDTEEKNISDVSDIEKNVPKNFIFKKIKKKLF
ncbi:hypothetical protein PFNF135_03464 [Plasmodium falciparum NF135/5.C10]|uniref:W2 domain-containing protein n=1 Tax=Plasmodium falciparum NF135/5.C10 TaxID=1036726 RepID=W4IE56_PLAFA|nr:hypothetical protein PFNF135_03464 [Plasmodium falciparum NF135/5.C10]